MRMDALQLIDVTRGALARDGKVSDIVAEAWQAQALAEAVGSRLAICGPPELRAGACRLSESGSRACSSLRRPPMHTAQVRAARMTAMHDPRCTLRALGALLSEAGVALVRVASTARADGLYWQCLEAIDAADESGERTADLLRRLTQRERDGVAGARRLP